MGAQRRYLKELKKKHPTNGLFPYNICAGALMICMAVLPAEYAILYCVPQAMPSDTITHVIMLTYSPSVLALSLGIAGANIESSDQVYIHPVYPTHTHAYTRILHQVFVMSEMQTIRKHKTTKENIVHISLLTLTHSNAHPHSRKRAHTHLLA